MLLRKHIAKLDIVVAALFWAFTWHCFAVGAVNAYPSSGAGRSEIRFKDAGACIGSKIQTQAPFKRRPFLIKSDAISAPPYSADHPFVHSSRIDHFKQFIFLPRLDQSQFLRAPPALIR